MRQADRHGWNNCAGIRPVGLSIKDEVPRCTGRVGTMARSMDTRRDDDAGWNFPSGTVRSRIGGHGQHVDRIDPPCIRSKCFEIPNSGAEVQVVSRVCFSRLL